MSFDLVVKTVSGDRFTIIVNPEQTVLVLLANRWNRLRN